jgi:hypothetical protein
MVVDSTIITKNDGRSHYQQHNIMQISVNEINYKLCSDTYGLFELIYHMIVTYNEVILTDIERPDLLINVLTRNFSSKDGINEIKIYLDLLDYLLATDRILTEFYKVVSKIVPISTILCNRFTHNHRQAMIRCYYPSSFCINYSDKRQDGLVVTIDGQSSSKLINEDNVELYIAKYLRQYLLPREYTWFWVQWTFDPSSHTLDVWSMEKFYTECVGKDGCFDLTSLIISHLDKTLYERYNIRSLLIKRPLCNCSPPPPKYKIVKHRYMGGLRNGRNRRTSWQINDSTANWSCKHNIRRSIATKNIVIY